MVQYEQKGGMAVARANADRALLALLGVWMLLESDSWVTPVVVGLAAVTLSAANGYLERPWATAVGAGLYGLICLWLPEGCAFFPLVLYDLPQRKAGVWIAGPLLAGALSLAVLPGARPYLVWIALGLSAALRLGTLRSRELSRQLKRQRDSSYELTLLMQARNRELMAKQDDEVRLATLNERNRIAREIHDHVGHMLSRSILQVGAMQIVTEDAAQREQLGSLQQTLSAAMDHIRDSVHDLHDDAVDLSIQLRKLVKEFTFCSITLDNALEHEPGKAEVFCILAIAKEALSNVMRHSDATQVRITLREHPALIQMVVQDNGRKHGAAGERGMGLENMAERVHSLGGQFTAGYENGFRIFLSIPKKEVR